MIVKNKVDGQELFGTTREPKAIYKILANASKKNLEKRIKKKTKLIIIKKKFPTFNFIIFFLYSILVGKIFQVKILYLLIIEDVILVDMHILQL